MKIDISELSTAFPAFRVGIVIARDITIPPSRDAMLDATIAEREATARTDWGATELGKVPGIAVWRQAYKAFGIKSTGYRCSVERLVKNALAHRALPAINGFVDAYNATSLHHVFPIGADDLDLVMGDLAFRYARDGDSFLDMAAVDKDPESPAEAEAGAPSEDPPKPGEIVYADAAKVLCRRWNWRQDARSLVSPATTRAVLTVQSNGAGDLEAALDDVATLISRACGGRIAITIADATNPIRDLAGT